MCIVNAVPIYVITAYVAMSALFFSGVKQFNTAEFYYISRFTTSGKLEVIQQIHFFLILIKIVVGSRILL